MGRYTEEAQKILEDFLEAIQKHPDANELFIAQLKTLVKDGRFTNRKAINDVIESLKQVAVNES